MYLGGRGKMFYSMLTNRAIYAYGHVAGGRKLLRCSIIWRIHAQVYVFRHTPRTTRCRQVTSSVGRGIFARALPCILLKFSFGTVTSSVQHTSAYIVNRRAVYARQEGWAE